MTVEEVLAAAGLSGYPYETDEFSEDNYPEYVIRVPRDRVDDVNRRLRDVDYSEFIIRVKQQPPPLVPAAIGQFVRVYSRYETDDDESPLALVTSEHTVDGKTAYGCRYLEVCLERGGSTLYPFVLRHESYTHLQPGFLKVVPPGDLPAILRGMVDAAHRKAAEDAEQRYKSAVNGVEKVVAALSKREGPTRTVTAWSPYVDQDASLYLSVEDDVRVVVDYEKD